eukprot:TRINITY_DN10594_c1_g1_i3.p2 TRINITY_DN10594_c1_g1~~TRINITY_DN10594_c1_g1_i3.p2  ORF type:complete len:169 (-),score=19.94 TRINITY_DN10594_c1_g1_i3:360-866(-)
MWKTSFLVVIWTLWEERNSRCFKGVSSSKEAMAFKVKYLIASWVSVLPNFRGYSIDDISRCWKEVVFTHPILPWVCHTWKPPPLGNLKLNFDGSAIGIPCQLGIGGVFGDSAGVKLISFWGPSGFKTVNEVEMIALRRGLREADKIGFRKFIVEGDSLCAIRWASWFF